MYHCKLCLKTSKDAALRAYKGSVVCIPCLVDKGIKHSSLLIPELYWLEHKNGDEDDT